MTPDSREPDPEQAIDARQPEPASVRPFEHVELVPQRENLELERDARAPTVSKHQ